MKLPQKISMRFGKESDDNKLISISFNQFILYKKLSTELFNIVHNANKPKIL
jgi:hypothetical protein